MCQVRSERGRINPFIPLLSVVQQTYIEHPECLKDSEGKTRFSTSSQCRGSAADHRPLRRARAGEIVQEVTGKACPLMRRILPSFSIGTFYFLSMNPCFGLTIFDQGSHGVRESWKSTLHLSPSPKVRGTSPELKQPNLP